MNFQVLKNLSSSQNLGRSDLACLAKVSRAAVTRWFQHVSEDGWINVETDTLRELAKNMGVNPAMLLQERPSLISLHTRFLWDSIFPNMEFFLKALKKFELPAVARLVQVLGFYDSQLLLGHKVIKAFPKYKKFLKPPRQKELELLWELYL